MIEILFDSIHDEIKSLRHILLYEELSNKTPEQLYCIGLSHKHHKHLLKTLLEMLEDCDETGEFVNKAKKDWDI